MRMPSSRYLKNRSRPLDGSAFGRFAVVLLLCATCAVANENVCHVPPPEQGIAVCSGGTDIRASVTLTEPCGSLTDGTLGQYAGQTACQWIIEPPGATSINITFTRFDVESAEDCSYDSLTITDYKTVDGEEVSFRWGSFCGGLQSNIFCALGACLPNDDIFKDHHVLFGSKVEILLASDESVHADGFALTWTSSTTQPPTDVVVQVPKESAGDYAVVRELYDAWTKQTNNSSSSAHGLQLQWDPDFKFGMCTQPGILCRTFPDSDHPTTLRVTQLFLIEVNLDGTIPASIGNLTQLERVNLQSCRLKGSIPSQIGALSHLMELQTPLNALSGSIPLEICNCNKLQDLSLQDNKLTGTIPSTLANLTSLRKFYIRSNHISGVIPSGLGALRHLEQMDVSRNLISGTLATDLGLLGLTHLVVTHNRISGTLPSELFGPRLRQKLEILSINNNFISGTFPSEIDYFDDMIIRSLDASNNKLTGTLPHLTKTPELDLIIFGRNEFHGSIPWTYGELSVSQILLDSNQLTGEVPTNLCGRGLPRRVWISENRLSGTIPIEIAKTCRNANELYLANNRFSGTLSSEFGSISPLGDFRVHGNLLSGTIPVELSRLSLFYFDLHDNRFSGSFPSSIWMVPSLARLSLAGADMLIVGSFPLAMRDIPGAYTLAQGRTGSSLMCPVLEVESKEVVVSLSPHYYGYSRCHCTDGMAGVAPVCFDCPYGAVCADGRSLHVRLDFWCNFDMYRSGDIIERCYSCPSGYCCSSASCPIVAQCADGRAGTLCGECVSGHSAAIGSSGCVPDNDCNDAVWVISVGLVLAVLFVSFLATTYRNSNIAATTADTGHVAFQSQLLRMALQSKSVLVHFYQLAGIVLEQTVTARQDDPITKFTVAIFDLDFEAIIASRGSSTAICLRPGLSTVSKVVLNYLIVASLLLVSVIGLLCLRMFGRVWNRHRGATRQLMQQQQHRQHQPHTRWTSQPFSGLLRATLVVMVTGYSNVTRTTFQLLRCVDVDGVLVLRASASVQCFTYWQQIVFVFAAILVVAPMALAWWIGRAQRRERRESFQRSVAWVVFVSPFRDGVEWWVAVLLYQRLTLIVIFSFVPDVRARSVLLCCALIIALAVNFAVTPRRVAAIQVIEYCVGVILATLAALGILSSCYSYEGIDSVDMNVRISTVSSVLVLFPLFALLSLFAIGLIDKITKGAVTKALKRVGAFDYVAGLRPIHCDHNSPRQQQQQHQQQDGVRLLQNPNQVVSKPGFELAILHNGVCNPLGDGTTAAVDSQQVGQNAPSLALNSDHGKHQEHPTNSVRLRHGVSNRRHDDDDHVGNGSTCALCTLPLTSESVKWVSVCHDECFHPC